MSSMQSGRVRIGTSGIVLPGPKPTFPAEFRAGSRLHYYGLLFDTLEINSSFYKIPQAKTFAKWATEVPADFKFTVKLWRGITHEKKLDYAEEDVDKFMDAVNCMGSKRGCLLIQFPASIRVSYLDKVTALLLQLAKLNAFGGWHLALEVRHDSWYIDSVYAALKKIGVALVVHDMPGSPTPQNVPQSDIAYFRFHGPAGDYRGSYSPEFLQRCAKQVEILRAEGIDVFVYFNNTIDGALENAMALRKLIS